MGSEPIVMHYWGDNATSPCGRYVASAYSTNGHGYTSNWTEVDCPACLAENSRTSGTKPEEPSYMMFARTNVRMNEMSSPRVVKLLIERIDALTAQLDNLKENQ